jgi:predicted polyphosphate/ATP-dependent NAD kinase
MEVALKRFEGQGIQWITCKGSMGENLLNALYMPHVQVLEIGSEKTSGKDTQLAVFEMLKRGVELIVFAGGDGTARDVASACGHQIPILGIPAGVKMHSAVFAKSPMGGGDLISRWAKDEINKFEEVDIVDLDEQLYRQGIVTPVLYCTALVPFDQRSLQCKKSRSSVADHSAQIDLAWEVIRRMDSGVYLLGPGTTTYEICKQLNQEATLIGFDAMQDKQIIAKDLSEAGILELLRHHSVKCILTPVGGQGFLLGRGNQQLTPQVIRSIDKENIMVIATSNKLQKLCGNPLLVDTGDPELDQALSGYKRIVTGIKEERVYPISY